MGKDVYFEFGNTGDSSGWALGTREDYGLHIGYGPRGTMPNSKSMVIRHNRVEVLSDAVFYKSPKYYYKQGNELTLNTNTDKSSNSHQSQPPGINGTVTAPGNGTIPDVPVATDDSLVSAGSAEPLVVYKSNDVNLQLVSDAEVI